MDEWGDSPPMFDRSGDAWALDRGAMADDDEATQGEQFLELIGSQLWVAGTVQLGRFRRVADFVNIVDGYLVVREAVVRTRTGEATPLTMPELRIRPEDITVVGQPTEEASSASADSTAEVQKMPRRLVVLTRSHLIDGDIQLHADGSIMAFVDATDPKFIPMTDVR